jgi:ribokinase
MATKNVAIVGSLNTDLVTYLQVTPSAGETVFGDSFKTGFGGKGSNQAVMARMCGAEVYMIGCIGNDAYGRETRTHLADLGLRLDYLQTADTSSGVALIWVEPDGANRIVIVAGANAKVDSDEVTRALNSIGNLGVVVGQLEIPIAVTRHSFSTAKTLGAITVLNPAPAQELAKDFLSSVDWLVPNEHEFESIFGEAANKASIVTAASELSGARTNESQSSTNSSFGLVVTLGKEGALVWSGADQQVTSVQTTPVNAIDTTGAGDAFVGAFAVALARGLDPVRAAAIGCRCASDSVTRIGAQESFPSPEATRRLFDL